MTKALGQKYYVYLHLGKEELSSIINSLFLMDLNGMNWGIKHVQESLARHNYKIPKHDVIIALRIILAYHYDQ
jgi:hypothetical protein